MKNLLKVDPNERVDLSDFQYLANESISDQTTELINQFLCNSTTYPRSILSGFDMSNPSGNQVRVETGKAILHQRLNGVVVQSVLATTGDTYKIIDLSTYADNTYGIYLRFEQIPGSSDGRIFWNSSGTGSEYTQTMETRYTANWSLRIEVGSPGAEWFQIGTVVKPGMSITDSRDLYFEGPVDQSYQSGWSSDGGGSSTDRNPNRATYGITDLHTFVSATRQCLEDIKGRGLRNWYESSIGGMNIGFTGDPTLNKLAIGDTNFYMKMSGANVPSIQFDDGSYFEYTRTTDTLAIVHNTDTLITIDSTGTTINRHLDVTPDSGSIGATITANGNSGLVVAGEGAFAAISASAELGQNANAINGVGRGTGAGVVGVGETGGSGVFGSGVGCIGVKAETTGNFPGISTIGGSSGGATSHGILTVGGDNGGAGIRAEAGHSSGYGVDAYSNSTATAIYARNASTGQAIIAESVSTGGAPIVLVPMQNDPTNLVNGAIWFISSGGTHQLKCYINSAIEIIATF